MTLLKDILTESTSNGTIVVSPKEIEYYPYINPDELKISISEEIDKKLWDLPDKERKQFISDMAEIKDDYNKILEGNRLEYIKSIKEHLVNVKNKLEKL